MFRYITTGTENAFKGGMQEFSLRSGGYPHDFNTRNKHNSSHNAIVWRSWVCGSSAPKRQLRSCPDQPISITLWPPCAVVNHGHPFDPWMRGRESCLQVVDKHVMRSFLQSGTCDFSTFVNCPKRRFLLFHTLKMRDLALTDL